MIAEIPKARKRGNYIRTSEIRQKQRSAMLGHPVSIKTRHKLSEAAKHQIHTHERDEKVREALKGRTVTWAGKVAESVRRRWEVDEDYRERCCRGRKGRVIGPEWRKSLSIAGQNRFAKHAEREAQSNRLKNLWRNPEFRQRALLAIAKAQHQKPNKAEEKLQSILDKYSPYQWQYTGDGKLVIGGYRPDFANRNGLKLLIELFGDYWHNRKGLAWHQTELGKIMAYHSLGFKCLVVWEKELEDEQELVDKIAKFMRSKVCSSRKSPTQC